MATNIIKRLSDNVVLYAGDNVALTALQATSDNGSTDRGTTTANAVLVAGVTLPVPWTGGAYSYNGSFAVVDQPLLDATLNPQDKTLGDMNFKALVRRRAADLVKRGKQYEAILLLKSIRE